MPRIGKCVKCLNNMVEHESLAVKELPCKHYSHSHCLVFIQEEFEEAYFHEEGEEAYCSCRCRIPKDWLKITVDEFKDIMAQSGIYY